MKRLWVILLLVSCTTAPKINYEGDVNDDGLYYGKGVITSLEIIHDFSDNHLPVDTSNP